MDVRERVGKIILQKVYLVKLIFSHFLLKKIVCTINLTFQTNQVYLHFYRITSLKKKCNNKNFFQVHTKMQ